jgi:outer membrane biosynthesis protein TonB
MKFAITIIALASLVLSITAQNESVVEPKIIKVPNATLPSEAKETGLGGRVSVLVSVDEEGNVTAAEDAAGPDWVCPSITRADVVALRNAAKTAAMDARFEPARRNGQPVASTIRLNFDFARTEIKEANSERYSIAVDSTFRSAPPLNTNKGTVKGDINDSVGNPPRADHARAVNAIPDNNQYTMKPDETIPPMTLIPGGRITSDGVLNGKAINLPKPPYPPAARAVRAFGAVTIQVLIDEDGHVFSAMAVVGHPLLRSAARASACSSAFSPTFLLGEPVKVMGVITYNFTL